MFVYPVIIKKMAAIRVELMTKGLWVPLFNCFDNGPEII